MVPTPDVAVIIPAHRSADVLDTTLASVAGQTVGPDVVVVVDDASGDETPDVARSWADRLPVTVTTLERNLGPAGARRVGIASTSARRLALLDADDVWLPDHLEVLLAAHDEHGGVVTARPLRWLPGEGIGLEHAGSGPPPPANEQRAAILRRNFVFIGSVFDRALYDAAGGFRDQFHGTEDWDLWIRMIRHGATVHRADHPTVLYRLSAGSVSADERMVDEERKVIETAMDEVTDATDRSALRTARRQLAAKAAMYRAYDRARNGAAWRARVEAARGLRGPGRVPLRCAALLLAPGPAVRARDRRVHEARWWLRP